MTALRVHICWTGRRCWQSGDLDPAMAEAVAREAVKCAATIYRHTGEQPLCDLVIEWPALGLAYSITDQAVLDYAG